MVLIHNPNPSKMTWICNPVWKCVFLYIKFFAASWVLCRSHSQGLKKKGRVEAVVDTGFGGGVALPLVR